MKKFEDKLRNLKHDIPNVSSALDDIVINEMINTTPKRSIFTLPKLALIAGYALPLIIVTLTVALTISSPIINNPQTGGNTEENNSFENNAPDTGMPAHKFIATKSQTTMGVDHVDGYSHLDLTYATSAQDLQDEVNKYHINYQALLTPLISDMIANEPYFTDNSVAIVPFVFSSSEKNIELDDVFHEEDHNATYFMFSLYSPLENDMDLNVMFYVITLPKVTFNLNKNNNLVIKVLNKENNSTGSMYYN